MVFFSFSFIALFDNIDEEYEDVTLWPLGRETEGNVDEGVENACDEIDDKGVDIDAREVDIDGGGPINGELATDDRQLIGEDSLET